jgi:TolB protein
MIRKLFLFPLVLFGVDLEVRLSTESPLKPIVISHLNEEYGEALREVLVSDLNASGFVKVVEEGGPKIDLEMKKGAFLAGKFSFQMEQDLKMDRAKVHFVADQLLGELFGAKPIFSSQLLFAKRTADGKGGYVSEIWVADVDLERGRQLTHQRNYCVTPFAWPKRNEFCFVSYKTGQPKIYTGSLEGGEMKEMISLRGGQLLPALNKKGNLVAFITDVAGRPDLFIQSLAPKGKPRQLFSAARATQASPTFSPDGSQIAFVSDKDGPPRIYLMETVGKSVPVLLTKMNRENTSPCWSPDGKWLAYSAKVDGIRQIWLYDFETGQERALTNGAGNKENPSFGPDSFHLVYNTEGEEEGQIYLINLTVHEPIHLGPGRFPTWVVK